MSLLSPAAQGMVFRKFVSNLEIFGERSWHKYSNAFLDTLRFSLHCLFSQPWHVSSQNECDRGIFHNSRTDTCCERFNIKQNKQSKRTTSTSSIFGEAPPSSSSTLHCLFVLLASFQHR